MRNLASTVAERQPSDGSPTAAQDALPGRVRKPLSSAECQSSDDAVGKLKAHLLEQRWTGTPEEISALDSRDGCYVRCQLIVNGFPVSEENSWADSTGSRLANSMVPMALQIGALGLYETCFVRMLSPEPKPKP